MTVDVFVPRRRGLRLGLVTFALIIALAAGGTYAVERIWLDKPAIAAPGIPIAAPVDPVQTGSVAAGDAIGDMIEKLDTKAPPKAH
jgi:hypothetical protein